MSKLPIKIIFVDIDWTIFDQNKASFDIESMEVLKKAQENGYLVYIATARPYHSVMFLKLFDYITPDGMITSNGSAIFDNDNLIYGLEIPTKVVKNVCKVAVKHHMNVEITGPKSRFTYSKRMKHIEDLYKTFYDEIPQYQKFDGGPVITMMVAGPSKWDEEILAELPKTLFHYRFDELGMDISASPTQKGHAVEICLKNLGISKENALSIGDSDLDITMFQNTKYSIAVGNAKDHIKEKATFVADSLENHGVGKMLKELLEL